MSRLDEHEKAIGGDEPTPISAWLTVLAIITTLIIGSVSLVFLGDSYENWIAHHTTSCAGKF